MAQVTDAADLAQHVVSEAERLEDIEQWDEIGELDVQYRTTDQYVSRVYITVTIGGPQIEIDALHGIVRGYWSGDEFSTHFRSDVVREYGRFLADEMEARLQA
jgi:hypothetical protein